VTTVAGERISFESSAAGHGDALATWALPREGQRHSKFQLSVHDPVASHGHPAPWQRSAGDPLSATDGAQEEVLSASAAELDGVLQEADQIGVVDHAAVLIAATIVKIGSNRGGRRVRASLKKNVATCTILRVGKSRDRG